MASIDLHNTFCPGQEIVDPDLFAGRKDEIFRALGALLRPGCSMLVYGERGVGKTSFVEMVKLIAMGQVELIYRYKLHHRFPPQSLRFQVAAIECDDDVDNTAKVLQRLITSPDGIRKLLSSRIESIESTLKDELTISLLKGVLTLGGSSEDKIVRTQFKEDSVFELFANLVQSISYNILGQDEGLLIVVDEFDRVKDNRKMASVIKTLSKNRVKFLICGVANSYTELLQAHESVERQFFNGKIETKPMDDDEIEDIFTLASGRSDGFLTFNKEFLDCAKDMAGGFPYYAQLFGQLALDNYATYGDLTKPIRINSQHLVNGLAGFARHEPEMDAVYRSVVGNYPEREIMLRGLAHQIPRRILQSQIFRYCEKRGVAQPKKVLSYLIALKGPEIIQRTSKDYVTFANPLFKIFCSVREPLYSETAGAESGVRA